MNPNIQRNFQIRVSVSLVTFFTNNGGINAESITIAKTSLLKELLHMMVQREVKVSLEHIGVARKTLTFKYFSGKLCQVLFEINKLINTILHWMV